MLIAVRYLFNKSQVILFLLLFYSFSFANSGITYHGRILRPDGITAVSSVTTQFRVQIRTPGTENCLLWEEQQTKDLSQSAGVFTLTIADSDEPSLIANTLPFTLERVFSNRSGYTGLTNCSSGTIYSPSSAVDGRNLQVFFRENPADLWEQMPLTKINFVPLALNSVQLEGFQAADFLKIDPLSSYTTLTSANVNTLVDLIAGTNSQYLKPSTIFAGDVTGDYDSTVVEKIRGTNVSATAPTAGQILKFDGTSYVPAADDSGSTVSDSSYSVKGVVQINTDLAASGLFISSGVLSLPNVVTAGSAGTAQSVPVITYDQKGRLTAVSSATIDDTTKLPLAGGTMTGSINMGGQNITNAASITATNSSIRNLILNDNDTNTATLRAPTDITTNYTLTLPSTVPVAGNVLSTDASGNLSWVTTSNAFVQNGNSFATDATLGTNDNNALHFETNGTPKMTILANGNVGIGTTTPGISTSAGRSYLTIKGSTGSGNLELTSGAAEGSGVAAGAIQFTDSNSTGAEKRVALIRADIAGVTANNRGGQLHFYVKPDGGASLGEVATILANGNMGIGVLNPAYKLDVAGDVNITGQFKINGTNIPTSSGLTSLGGQTGATQTFASGSTGNSPAISSASNIHTLNVPLASSGVSVTSGTISNADYVSFAAKLTSPLTSKGDLLSRDGSTHIRLPAGTDGQVLSADSAEASGLKWIAAASGDVTEVVAGAGLTGGASSGSATVNIAAGNGILVNADDIAVDAGLGANKIPQVGGTALGANGVIVANGTATALTSLNCTIGQVIKFNVSGFATCGSDSDSGSVAFQNGGNSFAANATLGTNDNYTLNFETNGTTKMTVLANGNVGIGTTTPTEKLDVNGAVKLGTTATSSAGTIRWDGIHFQGYDGSNWNNFVPNPAASGTCDQTNTYSTAGTYSYTVPASFGTITIQIWGGGGGGGGASNYGGGSSGATGGTSSISALSLTASGGIGGSAYNSYPTTGYGAGGSGGTASGGVTNTPGTSGGTGSASISGSGAAAPLGGTGGTGVSISGTGVVTPGNAGTAPGGGGSGGAWKGDPAAANTHGGGGGSGSYLSKTFSTATLSPGTVLTAIVVGAGGTAGTGPSAGGAGGAGRVSITCASAGAPVTNDRGIVFMNGGNYATTTTFIYDASGNVGIGTTNPGTKLEVAGQVKITGGTPGAGKVLTSDATGLATWETLSAAGDIEDVVAGSGLTGGASSGSATVNIAAGNGILVNADDIAVDAGLGANKIPQVGGTALGANGVIVANGTATALTSLNCTIGQVIKFDISGFATCGSDSDTGATGFLNGGNSFAATATLGTNDNQNLAIETNGTTKVTVLNTGNVGVGTATPATKLDVGGTVKVGDSGESCSTTTKGSIRYNNTTNVLEFCNGTGWNLVQAAACTDATPTSFVFTDQSNQTTTTLITSDIVQVNGLNCNVPVTISGVGSPQFQICSDSGCSSVIQGWTSSPSSIISGQYMQLRQTSDAAGGATTFSTIIVGGTASIWSVSTAGGDCVGTTPPVGTVCADGTIYAGLSPDGNKKMFTTRCDFGKTWNGSICSGTVLLQTWNNGTSNTPYIGYTSTTTGKSNSANLFAAVDAGAPYNAVAACENLTENSKTDWYLPARYELEVVAVNETAIKNFDPGWHLSSTEHGVSEPHSVQYVNFPGGSTNRLNKTQPNRVRCIRRDP